MTNTMQTTGSGKVYSYMRFSSERQRHGTSIDRQSHYAEVWAKEHGMILDKELTMSDEGLSAFHQRHVKSGALGVFLKSVEGGRIAPGSVLIVEGLDRLSRAEPMIAQTQLNGIIHAGVSVITAADGKVYSRETLRENPMNLIYSLLVMIRAHEESDTKSRRGKSAIEKQCQNWVAGTFRGKISAGQDPFWVRWNGSAFELIESEAEQVRRIVALYLAGYGSYRIGCTLLKSGYTRFGLKTHFNIHALLKSRNHLLIGTRLMNANNSEYRLENYYPSVIDQATYNELISSFRGPKRRGREASVPAIFTGLNGVFRCGYCGSRLAADGVKGNYKDKKTGREYQGHRRIRCPHAECLTGSSMLVPLEKALLTFCSDQMNLNGLIGQDRSAEIRARLAQNRIAVGALEKQLARIVDAMLATDAPPAAFAARAREAEKDIAARNHEIRIDEAALLSLGAAPTTEAAQVWAALAAKVANDDIDARVRVRKLVGDTFERIVFYRFGVTPPADRAKFQKDKYWDLLLVSKSGVTRHLRLDRAGNLIGQIDEARPLKAA